MTVWLRLLCIAWLLGSNAGAALSPVEQFKQFISCPPVISNLVFRQKVPMRGGIKPLDGTFALSRNWEYFHARWQTNAILFRRLSGPDDVTNFTVASQLVSWSGHQHALVGPPALLTTWDDRDPSVPRRPISFLYTSHCELDPLRDVLNLGIMYAEIGSVRWDGNRFGTECMVHRDRVLISGELFPEPDGPPRALTVHYAFPHSALHYVIRYGYHCNAPPAIPPTVITSFWITRDPKGAQIEMELNQWRILDFQTAATPMAAEAFDAAPFAQSNRWTALVYTNGGFYERTTNGTLRLAYVLPTPSKPPIASSPAARRAFYACWGGLNLALFALMLGAKETKSQATSTQSKDYQV